VFDSAALGQDCEGEVVSLFVISQVGISLFGATAFLLVTRETIKLQKMGVILGLISNPFWWLMVTVTEQWITIPVHLLYTYGWLRKGYVLWLRGIRHK
jgi:hypothetical protein